MRRAAVVNHLQPVPLALVARLDPLVLGEFHIADANSPLAPRAKLGDKAQAGPVRLEFVQRGYETFVSKRPVSDHLELPRADPQVDCSDRRIRGCPKFRTTNSWVSEFPVSDHLELPRADPQVDCSDRRIRGCPNFRTTNSWVSEFLFAPISSRLCNGDARTPKGNGLVNTRRSPAALPRSGFPVSWLVSSRYNPSRNTL